MSNAKIYYGKIPVGEGKPQVLNVVDNLTSTDPDKPLSANQGYILSQKFMKDVQLTQDKELIITYYNGNTYKYDLTIFLNSVISSIGYGKCIYCDALPTCSATTDSMGNIVYEVTYEKSGISYTIDASNIWFYYETNVSGTNKWVQTLFVEGQEVTIEAGGISDVVTIDSTTKHWCINGKDTGVCASGDSIEENAANTSTSYKLDIKKQDGTITTTPNLHGADGVILDNIGYYGFRVENEQLILYVNVNDANAADVDDQAPPFSLEGNFLYYTIGGKIKYISKETV